MKSIKGLKWLPAKILLFGLYPYSLDYKERVAREVEFMISWKNTPRVVAWGPGVIIREFVRGRVMTHDEVINLAETIVVLHKVCWRLGDTKYDNFLVTEDGNIIVLDAEQSIRSCDERSKVADLVIALLFTCLAEWPNDNKSLLFYYNYTARVKINKKYFLHPGVILLLMICPRILFKVLKELLTVNIT